MVCLLGLTACNAENPVAEDKATRLEGMASAIIEGAFAPLDSEQATTLTAMGAEYMEYVFENSMGLKVNGQGMITGFDSWNKAIKEIGDFKEIKGYTAKYNSKGNGIIITADVECENGSGQVEIIFKDDLNNTVESAAFNINYTFGQKMARAGLNTLMGMGTVFVVLILISLIISLFNYIPKVQALFEKKEEVAAVPVTNSAPVLEDTSEEVDDEEEIAAVIAAAVAAYEASKGGSSFAAGSDGFVVRSIRRRK